MTDEFNHWDDIAERFDKALGQVVRKTAFDGKAAIQRHIQANDQIDTGFMLNSVYVVTSKKSTYGKGVQVAKLPSAGAKGYISKGQLKGYVKRRERQRAQEAMLLPQLPPPPDEHTAYVAVAAEYAEFQNYGTAHQAARPFFEPGMDDVRPAFEAALSKIEEKLGETVSGDIEDESV